MKFEILRTLNNKVFSSTLRRTTKDDENYAYERILEDDFGSIKVDTGGKYTFIVINKDIEVEDGNGSSHIESILIPKAIYDDSEIPTDIDYAFHKFIKDTEIIDITVNSEMTHICDAKEINGIEFNSGKKISPLAVAEFECRIFEEVIEKKITEAIGNLCAYKSNFETEDIQALNITVPCINK